MPKWIELPRIDLKYHPYQDAFWKARRARICLICKIEFQIDEHLVCPQCKGQGDRRFHRLLMLSGRRGGKTEAGAIAAVEEASIPNTIGWCCAPTNPKLNRYILPALERLIPASWVKSYSSEFGDIRLKNGSLIHLQTLESPDQGRGQGLHWVWLDEVCELAEEHWNVLRPSLTEHRGVAFFTSSPRSYDWVYKNFYKRAVEGFPGYWATRYATSENPIISKDELAEAKATMPDLTYRQEYEADFVTFTGSVYGEYLRENLVLRGDTAVRRVIPEWPNIGGYATIVGMDSGADHPFGAVKIISTMHGLVVVGEYLERDKSFVEHANGIKRMVANPNARYAINRNERQPMIELVQHGIMCQPANNDVVSGIERVKSWMHAGQLYFIEDTVPRTLEQMRAYRWAENTSPRDEQQRKERVFKKEDELPDCIRYALQTWPALPKPKEEMKLRDLTPLPEKTRQDIERMRKTEKILKESAEGTESKDEVGDFWGGNLGGDGGGW